MTTRLTRNNLATERVYAATDESKARSNQRKPVPSAALRGLFNKAPTRTAAKTPNTIGPQTRTISQNVAKVVSGSTFGIRTLAEWRPSLWTSAAQIGIK